jgi:plasmid maintenance system antidote protein VapI
MAGAVTERLAVVVRFPKPVSRLEVAIFGKGGLVEMITKHRVKFGRRLSALCDLGGVSYKDLAACLGLSERQVNNYLNGKQFPTGMGIVRLKLLFDVSYGVVMGDEPLEQLIDKEEVRDRLASMK